MTSRPLPQSPAYKEIVGGLLRLHQYTVEGRDHSPEYHDTCSSMENHWGKLTAAENERLGGLSEDLYSVSDPPPDPEPMNDEAQSGISDAFEARERGEWDCSLEQLRLWGRFVPMALLSYLRARIWENAGDKAVAAVFFDHACRLDPTNEGMRVAYLNCLKGTDRETARKTAEEILKESDKHTPNLVIQAAEILHGLSNDYCENDAAQNYRQLLGILTPLLARMKDEQEQQMIAAAKKTLREQYRRGLTGGATS